jgi:hypothetical protein
MPVELVQEEQIRTVGLQRGEELTELEISFTAGEKALGRLIAVGLKHEQNAARRGSGLRVQGARPHGIEEGQSEPDATGTAKQRSARQAFHGDTSKVFR